MHAAAVDRVWIGIRSSGADGSLERVPRIGDADADVAAARLQLFEKRLRSCRVFSGIGSGDTRLHPHSNAPEDIGHQFDRGGTFAVSADDLCRPNEIQAWLRPEASRALGCPTDGLPPVLELGRVCRADGRRLFLEILSREFL